MVSAFIEVRDKAMVPTLADLRQKQGGSKNKEGPAGFSCVLLYLEDVSLQRKGSRFNDPKVRDPFAVHLRTRKRIACLDGRVPCCYWKIPQTTKASMPSTLWTHDFFACTCFVAGFIQL